MLKKLPEELNYLAELYDYLQEKQRFIGRMMGSYVGMGSGMQKLIEGIGEILLKKQAVSRERGRALWK